MVGIPAIDEMTKNEICQEKSIFRNFFTVDDFGLEKGNKIIRVYSRYDGTLR